MSKPSEDDEGCVGDAALTQFVNCRLFKGGEFVREDLWVSEGRVIAPQQWFFGYVSIYPSEQR